MYADGIGRHLSKIEKRGFKVERATLNNGFQELAEIQGLQEAAIKVNLSLHILLPDPFFSFVVMVTYSTLGRDSV